MNLAPLRGVTRNGFIEVIGKLANIFSGRVTEVILHIEELAIDSLNYRRHFLFLYEFTFLTLNENLNFAWQHNKSITKNQLHIFFINNPFLTLAPKIVWAFLKNRSKKLFSNCLGDDLWTSIVEIFKHSKRREFITETLRVCNAHFWTDKSKSEHFS